MVADQIRLTDEQDLDFPLLAANASILVIAGSETTATLLSGATYLLASHRDELDRATHEVRSAFKSAEEVTLASVGQLPYLLAVLNESLRCYPPVTAGLVRVVPEEGQKVADWWVPGGVRKH